MSTGPRSRRSVVRWTAFPFFFKLDSRACTPVDAIGTAEWDEETPGDMAPVLTEFVNGNYSKRREPPAVGTVL